MKTFRLTPETRRRLALVAQQKGMSKTVLVETALKAHMVKPRRTKAKTSKGMETFRLTPEIVRHLALAADQEGMSETVFVESALKAHFKKLGIE